MLALLNLFLAVLQHERDRLQALKEELVWETKLLQESVTASETRANTATDMNRRYEQQTLTKKDEEIKCQRARVSYLEETLRGREQELRRQSELLRQLTSALRWKGEGETLQKQIQKLQRWEEEEAEKRSILQERDRALRRQKELTQQLEDERRAKGEELERVVAILKQTESGEIEWKEKAQALTLALSKSEMANGALREEIGILQSMVLERDTDRLHLQVGTVSDRQPDKMAIRDSKDAAHKDMGVYSPVNIRPAWPKQP